jgi:hypothetical protein
MSSLAISALEEWALHEPAVAPLVASARRIARAQVTKFVTLRAAINSVDASAVVWSDARCDARMNGAALGAFPCDLRAHCKEAAIYFSPGKQRMDDLKMAASMPLNKVNLGLGSLQDLLRELGVRYMPRLAEVKAQALVVYDDEATVRFSTRSYGKHTNTFVIHGLARGHRTGDGMVGVAGKALQLTAPDGEGIVGGNPMIAVVTLWSHPPALAPPSSSFLVYRSLTTANIELSQVDVADMPCNLAGKEVLAARVDFIECNLVTELQATPDEVDAMCLRVLQRQLDFKHNKDLLGALESLKGEAYCFGGHGPHTLGSECPDCGELCVHHTG